MISTDVIIIGAGIAAYSVACRLCDNGKSVIMLTKSEKRSCNSTLAQGGNFRCLKRRRQLYVPL